MTEKVIVAGAGFLGVNTALKLQRKGFDVQIIDRNPYHQYIPGLIDIFRNRVSENQLVLNLNDFFGDTVIEFKQSEIQDINPEEDMIETEEESLSYDYLVLALGSDPASFGLDISETEHCYSLEGARELDNRLEGSDSALIIGGGYVGVELAGELVEKGLDVTVAEDSTTPMPHSAEKASKKALDYMNKRDIKFQGGKKAIELKEGKVIFEGEKTVEADTVIWSGGIQASKNVQEWFDTDRTGLEVNSGLCSKEYENIFAAGDCAGHDCIKTAHNAMEQAEVIAENIEKKPHEDLERFEESKILAVSMGDTGLLTIGKRTYKSRLFRYLKDLIRIRYWTVLKKEKLKAKIL